MKHSVVFTDLGSNNYLYIHTLSEELVEPIKPTDQKL